jgi:hypothetical protein
MYTYAEEDSIEEDSIEEDSIEKDSSEKDSSEKDSSEKDSSEEDCTEEDSSEEGSSEEGSKEVHYAPGIEGRKAEKGTAHRRRIALRIRAGTVFSAIRPGIAGTEHGGFAPGLCHEP